MADEEGQISQNIVEASGERPAGQPAAMNSDHSMDMYQRPASQVPEPAQSAAAPAPALDSLQKHIQGPPQMPRHDSVIAEVKQEIKTETGTGEGMDPPPTDATMQAIMAFLHKNNLLDTEAKLRDELKKREASSIGGGCGSNSGGAVGGTTATGGRPIGAAPTTAADNEVGNVLASYKSEGDPSSYESAYK